MHQTIKGWVTRQPKSPDAEAPSSRASTPSTSTSSRQTETDDRRSSIDSDDEIQDPNSGTIVYGIEDDETSVSPQEANVATNQTATSTPSEQIKETPEEEEKRLLEREIDLTVALQGQGVVKVHTVLNLGTDTRIMVQERAGVNITALDGTEQTIVEMKDFADLLRDENLSDENQMKMLECFEDVILGLERLHTECRVVHRDIKPENFLVTTEGKGVISDFGTTVHRTGDPEAKRPVGSPLFTSPESTLYRQTRQYDKLGPEGDIWAMGMVLYDLGLVSEEDFPSEMLLDLINLPATADDPAEMKLLIKREKGLRKIAMDKHLPDQIEEPEPNTFKHLCWRCLQADPSKRPNITGFWIEYQQILAGMKK